MKEGEKVTLNRTIRSQTTGVILPREGKVIRETENVGRTIILVNFGNEEAYIFPEEIATNKKKAA